ncbi:inosine/xanthosine triphosphatase [Deinococcus taeanensis]|uniref:inosine/xanthosine triphosphatase n=1 Tax=Deinococcus taeanensis TaxID=2737050 RepID=UPI001CDBCE07|nr:inosine/xanthosine triphosphatase [Deinococcus taeanensis]UBV43599.1 inosine/xanthosine triphosphatase [Deinococcus taeanensis]
MNVIVGSLNPGKVQPARDVFGVLFPGVEVRGLSVPSGVPDQPVGVGETRRGAVNRARAAARTPGAVWGVGLEGGVRVERGRGWLFGVVAAVRPGVRAVYTARTAELPVPDLVLARVLRGEELGGVMDELLGTRDLKRGAGTVGALTQGLVTRPAVWAQALALALAPAVHPQLYPGSTGVRENERLLGSGA